MYFFAIAKVRIGISGWKYDGWEGTFYPDNLPKQQQLDYASKQFDTLELNSTFYSLKRPENFR